MFIILFSVLILQTLTQAATSSNVTSDVYNLIPYIEKGPSVHTRRIMLPAMRGTELPAILMQMLAGSNYKIVKLPNDPEGLPEDLTEHSKGQEFLKSIRQRMLQPLVRNFKEKSRRSMKKETHHVTTNKEVQK